MTTDAPKPGPRVALISFGLGQIQRGFEKYCEDLFALLRDDIDLTLFKGRGTRSGCEKVSRLYPVVEALLRAVPLAGLLGGRDYGKYKRDCLAYGLSVAPTLMRDQFDIVHVVDPPLVQVIQQVRRLLNLRFQLLFTEATLMPPPFYPRGAHIHQLAQTVLQEAIDMGVPESEMTLIPCGVRPERFLDVPDRRELRRKYQISESTFVILAVTAVRRVHKRVHHLINEVSQLDGDVLLWIDGNAEDPAVPGFAASRLGSRCRITHVPSKDVPELHRVADVFAHAAVEEAFGLAAVEALCSGLPLLVHDSPHFLWLTQDRECLVDMRVPGRLAARLWEVREHKEEFALRAQARAVGARQRYDWKYLKPLYVAMYRKLAGAECKAPAREGEVVYDRP